MSAFVARREFLAAMLGLLTLPRGAGAKEIAGIALPDKARPAGGETEVRLLGSGVLRFLFIRYYVCGLYAAEGLADSATLLAGDAPRRVHIVALRRITSFEFLWGLDTGLADNALQSDGPALQAQLDQVRAAIRSIGAITAGTHVSVDYQPGAGTSILVDGRSRGGPIAGKALNDALMRVWIGERPLDGSLKMALLGG